MDAEEAVDLLFELHRRKTALDHELDQAVRGARDVGVSWQRIGVYLGMSAQGAWSRWADKREVVRGNQDDPVLGFD